MSVQTVVGAVKGEDLGFTLTHEHFNLDFSSMYSSPPQNLNSFFDECIKLDNVGYVKQYPYASKTNINFYGEDVDKAIVEEMKLFKRFGGGTIVENTSHGLGRNVDLMCKVARETGVNVIAGSGYYVEVVQPKSNLILTVEEMCERIRSDMSEGDVRCGFIGEVGSVWPITDFEKRAIQATAYVQQELSCPVSFHPGRDSEAPNEIIRIYTEAGGSVRKAVMSHLDRTMETTEQILEFAKLGSYCQFDLFGTECSFYQFNVKQDMPSDAQRIDFIKDLKGEKYLDKILMSHDIHTKHRLVNFGGHGFSHIINNVLPKMEVKGFTQDEVKQITVENPKKWLCF